VVAHLGGGAHALEALLEAGGVEKVLELAVEEAELFDKVLVVVPVAAVALLALVEVGEYTGNIQGTFRGRSGNVERTPVSLHPNCKKHLKKIPRLSTNAEYNLQT
jgi:hypothetical protein